MESFVTLSTAVAQLQVKGLTATASSLGRGEGSSVKRKSPATTREDTRRVPETPTVKEQPVSQERENVASRRTRWKR